jgi:hypothetical protein
MSSKSCLALFAFALLLFTPPLSAAIIRVPADQPTIQAGIDVAVDGDTVLVASGLYVGPGNGSTVKVFDYQDQKVTLDFSLDAFPSVYTHGVNVAAGGF